MFAQRRIVRWAVFLWDSVNYLCALMPISFAPFDPSISCASWIFLCSRNLSLLLRILDLSIFAHFGPLLFLRILDLSYFCAFWTSLIFAHFGFLLFLRILDLSYFCAFWIQLIMTARVYILLLRNIIFSISRIFYIHHSSFRALFYISRTFYSHHWLIRAFCISRMSSIFPLIRAFSHSANILHSSFHRSGLFLAFREYHTSIFLLFRAFFAHF